MKKYLIYIIIISILTVVVFFINESNLLKNLFNKEKMVNVSLCGETYSVVDININGRYITKELIQKESSHKDFSWCTIIKAVGGLDNSLIVKYNQEYPNHIVVIYRHMRFEYVIEKDNIYSVDQYAGGLGTKVLDLK